MKRTYLTVLISLLTISVFAQKADAIIGYYYSVDPFSKEGSQCYIYKTSNGSYAAKVVWVENPKKKDSLGYVFMTGLIYNAEDNEYQSGTLKYPGKPGTYKTYIRLVNNNKTLKMRGYWGVSMLGKTVDWTRESKIRPQN